MAFPKGRKNPNAGRKKGGHNSKPTFKKPKRRTGRKPNAKSLANLKNFKKGDSRINRKGRPKGSGTIDVHKVFTTLAAVVDDPRERLRRIDEWFYQLHKEAKRGRNKISAIRALMDWTVGSPAQTVKIMPSMDINIGVAVEIEQYNVVEADNVTIVRAETEKPLDGNGKGNGNGNHPEA